MTKSTPPVPVQDILLRKPSLHFEIFREGDHAWRWRLALDNGTVMGEAPSSFDSRRACLESIERMRETVRAPIYES